ncbi:CDP-glycerol glycerophosphotransferase family protein [Streptomyces sp. ISL-100]|uniref:CDP-glycerol glycerophosphotransferase family protein n=1 Tax=Streptomyces sp. ISL-100 TaxID=2819173 RepID=UPI001BE86B53|nr:CDP-glycerol glycerophosphotransferase family protein [Streptomyces sp. ISL-100]MBT2401593.1 CDP-glycerol glycerophosphotransferase family protein [Streptomyces sp. ISL-100]
MASSPAGTGIVPEPLSRSMKYFPEASEEDRAGFLAAAKEFMAGADPKKVAKFPPISRVQWYLAAQGRADELVETLRYERRNPGVYQVKGLRQARIELPGVDLGALPSRARKLNRRELPVRSMLTDMRWQDGLLVLRGYAYVPGAPAATGKRSVRIAGLRKEGGGGSVPLKQKTVLEPRATTSAKSGLHSYDWSGFEITIDPRRLRSRGRWQPGTWALGIGIPRAGGLSVGRVRKSDAGRAGHSQVQVFDDGVRVVAGFSEDRLQLSVDVVPAEVEAHEAARDGVELTVRYRPKTTAGRKPVALRVTHAGSEKPAEYLYPLESREGSYGDGWARSAAYVPFADLPVDGVRPKKVHNARVSIVFADGTSRRATIAQGMRTGTYQLPCGREVAAHTDGAGTFFLQARVVQPVVDRMRWTARGELSLQGTYLGPEEPMRLVIRHSTRHEERVLPVEVADGRFSALVTPETMPTYEGTLPLRSGRWYFTFRAATEWDHANDIPVTIRPDLVGKLPMAHKGRDRKYTVDRRFFDRFFLRSGSALSPQVRGGYRQRQLRETFYPQQQRLPLREAVLYNSFGGKQFSDSPRAVYQELVRRGTDVEHIAVVADAQAVLPAGVRGVAWGSEEWYEALARCRYVVTNVGINDWFTRREGQVVVQTWHGTPLKRIGADLLGTPKANLAYIASLPQRSRQFSLFVSPNAFTTPIMTHAFQLKCEVLEAGYPCNDVFHAEDREKTAARVREQLGIPEGKKVVLYAPTWRDDQRYEGKRFKLDQQVDLTAAEKALGHDHVFLYRKHNKVLDSIPGAGQGFVYDVAAYPDIADLYLIADVLITDYSSVLFDFAHSGRPMLFFTYDLEHYRDTLRGFYL